MTEDPNRSVFRNSLITFGPNGTPRGAVQRIKGEKDLRLALDAAFGLAR